MPIFNWGLFREIYHILPSGIHRHRQLKKKKERSSNVLPHLHFCSLMRDAWYSPCRLKGLTQPWRVYRNKCRWKRLFRCCCLVMAKNYAEQWGCKGRKAQGKWVVLAWMWGRTCFFFAVHTVSFWRHIRAALSVFVTVSHSPHRHTHKHTPFPLNTPYDNKKTQGTYRANTHALRVLPSLFFFFIR